MRDRAHARTGTSRTRARRQSRARRPARKARIFARMLPPQPAKRHDPDVGLRKSRARQPRLAREADRLDREPIPPQSQAFPSCSRASLASRAKRDGWTASACTPRRHRCGPRARHPGLAREAGWSKRRSPRSASNPARPAHLAPDPRCGPGHLKAPASGARASAIPARRSGPAVRSGSGATHAPGSEAPAPPAPRCARSAPAHAPAFWIHAQRPGGCSDRGRDHVCDRLPLRMRLRLRLPLSSHWGWRWSRRRGVHSAKAGPTCLAASMRAKRPAPPASGECGLRSPGPAAARRPGRPPRWWSPSPSTRRRSASWTG